MKIVSSKTGSSRERIDVQADLIPTANWRIGFEPAEPGFVRAGKQRHLVLPSRWGSERDYELWLTEEEAVAVARAVTGDLLTDAAKRLAGASRPDTTEQPAPNARERE